MEQDAASASSESTSSNSEYFCFHPNRFDAGYGKYMDPLQPPPPQNQNSMDVS
jgi:hypothetical protein